MCIEARPIERDDLGMFERILLWSIRAWAIGFSRGIPVEDKITEVCSSVGAAAIVTELYALTWILGHHADRPIAIDCVCNPVVSPDERHILAAFVVMAERDAASARGLLESMLSGGALDAALFSVARVTRALTAAGHWPASAPRRPIGRSTPATIH